LQLSLNAIDKKAADERNALGKKEEEAFLERQKKLKESIKKFDEERKAEAAAREQELLELDRAIADARLALVEDEQQKQINAVTTKYDALFELAKGDAERTRELQFLQNTELAKINAEFRQKELDANAEAEAKKRAEKLATLNADIDFTKQGIDALIALNDAFEGQSESQRKRAFKRRKALSIAQTLITTFQNANNAFASQVVVGDPTTLPRGIAAAAIATSFGLAQVASIAKQQYSGGSESGGSGGGGSAPSFGGLGGGTEGGGVPFAPVNTSFIQNVPNPQPVQAYVLTTSVTSGQHAQQKIEELSTL
jgi:hypothetical protein